LKSLLKNVQKKNKFALQTSMTGWTQLGTNSKNDPAEWTSQSGIGKTESRRYLTLECS